MIAGVVVALAPLAWSAALLAGAALVCVAFLEPLAGLGLAMVLGPLKALIGVAYPDLAALDPGQIFLALAFGGWVLRGLARRDLRIPPVPVALPLLAFLAVAALSLWAAADLPNGLKELTKWVQVLLVAVIVFDETRRRHVGWVLGGALLAGVVQALMGIWQFGLRGVGPEHFEIQPGLYRAYGAFEQPNPFGGFMGMVWPVAAGIALGMALDGRQRVRREDGEWRMADGEWQMADGGWRHSIPNIQYPISNYLPLAFLAPAAAAALTALALILSFSRGAWLGAIAAGGVMLVFWPRRRWAGPALGAGAVALALALLSFNVLPASISGRLAAVGEFAQVYDVRGVDIQEANFSLVERIAHWQAAVAMGTARPWLGVGFGNWDAAYADFQLLNWQEPLGHAHNIYLNVLAETGVLGLAAYLLLWGAVVGLTLRAMRQTTGWRRGAAVGLLGVWAHLAVHQLVDNLYVNNLHLYLGALFGVLSVWSARPADSHLGCRQMQI